MIYNLLFFQHAIWVLLKELLPWVKSALKKTEQIIQLNQLICGI